LNWYKQASFTNHPVHRK